MAKVIGPIQGHRRRKPQREKHFGYARYDTKRRQVEKKVDVQLDQ